MCLNVHSYIHLYTLGSFTAKTPKHRTAEPNRPVLRQHLRSSHDHTVADRRGALFARLPYPRPPPSRPPWSTRQPPNALPLNHSCDAHILSVSIAARTTVRRSGALERESVGNAERAVCKGWAFHHVAPRCTWILEREPPVLAGGGVVLNGSAHLAALNVPVWFDELC